MWECVVQAKTMEDVDEMEGSSERALEVAPNETLMVGHELPFKTRMMFLKIVQSMVKVKFQNIIIFLQQKNIRRNKPNSMLGVPSAKLVV